MITHKNLLNLPVETKSGVKLGRISGFDIDIDSQSIVRYYVKSENLIKGLFHNELIINRSQVISITEEKMVVEDNIAKEAEKVIAQKLKAGANLPAAASVTESRSTF